MLLALVLIGCGRATSDDLVWTKARRCCDKPLVRAYVIDAELTIDHGKVTGAHATGLGDRDADTCVEQALIGLRVPGSGVVRVTRRPP